jgi:hypothetical protein
LKYPVVELDKVSPYISVPFIEEATTLHCFLTMWFLQSFTYPQILLEEITSVFSFMISFFLIQRLSEEEELLLLEELLEELLELLLKELEEEL